MPGRSVKYQKILMRSRGAVFLIPALLFLVSCEKETQPASTAAKVALTGAAHTGDSATVLVAGGFFGYTPTGKEIVYAICWKNGVAIPLTTTGYSFATSITVNGNDVYITGGMTKGNSEDIATYWKNGNAITLTDGSTNARITAIAFDGADVYVAGWVTGASGLPIATYWKNGVPTALANDGFYSVANGIAVSGNNVYVVGQFMNGRLDSSTVMIWVNGVAQSLTCYPFSYATSVAISGSDVFVGGTSTTSIGWGNADTYWKDGMPVYLAVNGASSQINALAFSGNDLIATGTIGVPSPLGSYSAAWWKNGTRMPMTGFSENNYANGIAVNGQDVYISGGTNTESANDRAVYWKNGIPVLLKNGADSTGLNACGIAILPGATSLSQ